MPIFNSQVLIKTNESVFKFYVNFKKLANCRYFSQSPPPPPPPPKKKETKKTSPGINHRLKPYIESSYISPQPASPPNSI